MLRRFFAAAGTAAALITIPVLTQLLIRPIPQQRAALPLTLWCLAPAVWGLWAMAAPRSWVPRRLPLWGLILGFVGGSLGVVVLDTPSRVLGLPLSLGVRLLACLLVTAMYYLLWQLVRLAYTGLAANPVPTDLLDLLRHEAIAHPELDDAVKRLELALANLTVRTSGML